jgi:tetratricopeptide (TPR) repeat protein
MRFARSVLPLLAGWVVAQTAAASGATDLTSEGRGALAAGDDHRAVRLFTEAIALDRSLGDAYVGLARVRMKLGDAREAERALSAGLVHAPLHDALYESRARARRALGWHGDAIADMHEYATRVSTIEVWETYADFCGEGGQFPAQLAAWRRLADLADKLQREELQLKARRIGTALQLLVDTADPVLAPGLADPSRQAMASLAKRRAQLRVTAPASPSAAAAGAGAVSAGAVRPGAAKDGK